MIVERCLTNRDHLHRFTVTHDPTGWEVREEHDRVVTRQAHHSDWHRVERAMLLFDSNAAALEREGWIETHDARPRPDRP
jgi:hypothetical protein